MKIINIITAINNPILSNQLNEEKNIHVMCKDILYKEGIIDVLNKNKNIDMILISEKLAGEINEENLIKKIKEINKKIKIIYILEKQNKKLEKILKENNIKIIIYNDELNINKILEIINFKKNFYNNYINNNNFINKIITVSGPHNVGKTNFIINFFNIIDNKKILIVDFDLNNPNIKLFLGKKNKIINNKKYILIKKNNYEEIIKNYLIKIKKNKYIFLGINLLIKNKKNLFRYFINYIINNYDLILFDMGSDNNKELNNIIYEQSNYNLILMEGDFIGINKAKLFLQKNNYMKNIYLIINKKNKYNIDKNILNKIFKLNILGEIKYEDIYSNLININYKFNFKKINKKQYLNIYKKIYRKKE